MLGALTADCRLRSTLKPTVHPGHASCWQEEERAAKHSVCVTPNGNRVDIIVTHAAAGRVSRLRADALSPAESRVHLRRIFNDLGC